jgi:hypothetical protein
VPAERRVEDLDLVLRAKGGDRRSFGQIVALSLRRFGRLIRLPSTKRPME